MWRKKVAQALLAIVRIAVLVFAFLCLLYVVKDRYDTFMKNGIVMRRYISKFTEPWFEVAVCFGPKIPGDLVDEYMNRTWTRFPERYETYRSFNSQSNRTETFFRGAMAVDSVAAYRQFFTEGNFNWTDGVFGISSLTPSLLSQYLDGIRHRLSIAGKNVPDTVLRHTDIPFLLEYSICRNYTYNITFPRGYSDTLEHQIYVNDSVYEALFGIAWYVDLYVYPRSNFTEFPLIADHVPYRVDLRSHQLLDVVGKKTEKMMDDHHSVTDSSHTHVNCLTWCLARGMLDNVTCIMPMQIPYIYNTSERIPHVDVDAAGADGSDDQWRQLYPPEAAWPWMANYSQLPLCRSADEFTATFERFAQVYFPRGSKNWIYGAWEFFIDVSGMTSFVMGLSVLAIHDWVFLFVQWAMQFVGLEEADEMEESEGEDDWNRAVQALIQFHHLNIEETVRAPAGAVCSSLRAELTAMREAFAAVAGLEDGELASTKMNEESVREEQLREAACVGDVEALNKLIQHGVNVNSKNAINGW
ncbi:Ankyrin repeat domain-containing protein 40 [Amphibalanus amphitrite]|uniref:Ankyrin repeat domain-containing protein 40 n=1 Tax=Amphibalanus amphitrite TaxID=1232801 RepID=A0A6A4WU95_AMPAM|nr:Ankyrin repeat domain-containing protein 40 [Amphibalanus amphitrite]